MENFTIGIYVFGLTNPQTRVDSVYDRNTRPPHIVAVAPNIESANKWVEAHDGVDHAGKTNDRYVYSTISLDDDEAYVSRENAKRTGAPKGSKYRLLCRSDLIRILRGTPILTAYFT